MVFRVIVFLCFASLLARPAFSQSTPVPAFEIADVRVSDRQINVGVTGNAIRDGRYELHNATMVDLIRIAYGIEAEKVAGGPSWLELDRYTVIAKVPAATSVANARLMLKPLLADRFKLVAHEDTRPMTAFVMTVNGTHKMKVAASGAAGGCQPQPQQAEPGVIPPQMAVCRNMTMTALAQLLPRVASAYLPNPVADQTGLQGGFDFDITFHARPLLAQAGSEGISLFDALEKQLGLKLELKGMPTSALVVDSVERKPTPSSPDVARCCRRHRLQSSRSRRSSRLHRTSRAPGRKFSPPVWSTSSGCHCDS